MVLMFMGNLFPQKYWERRLKDYNNPDELVTMSQSLPFNEAIALLSKVSESTTGKRIVSTISSENPIGLEIENMPYDKALFMLVQYSGFTMEEKEDVIIVKRLQGEEVKPEDVMHQLIQEKLKFLQSFLKLMLQTQKKEESTGSFYYPKMA